MPRADQSFCCVIIGTGSLPQQCGELLLARGHAIAAVVPGDDGLGAWAQAQHLPDCAQVEAVPAFLGDQKVDYLFSISNPAIIPAPLLALPGRLAINYHDAPLPRYAGVHATSWAIMNGESAHGITWHVMAGQVDGGDVLVQRMVAIDPQDNAFTLNGKCFEAAIAAFADLIDGLAQDTLTPLPQNLSQRSYFGRLQRPANGGVIDWRQPAEAIDALCRADLRPLSQSADRAQSGAGWGTVCGGRLGIGRASGRRTGHADLPGPQRPPCRYGHPLADHQKAVASGR